MWLCLKYSIVMQGEWLPMVVHFRVDENTLVELTRKVRGSKKGDSHSPRSRRCSRGLLFWQVGASGVYWE